MGRLAGKVAIITGAARGQGAAEARFFVKEGARVLITDVIDEPGEALAKELGANARYMHLDVSKEAQWGPVVAAAGEMGPLNILVNNAAVLFAAAIDLVRERGGQPSILFLQRQHVFDARAINQSQKLVVATP